MKPGNSRPYPVWMVIRDWVNTAALTITSPSVISGRGPTLSVRRPASGPMTMITSVAGRNRTPV